MNNWKTETTYAIMTVKIHKVNKSQQMPIIAIKGNGVESTKYVNYAPTNPVIIDKLTLEDYIDLHEIDYEIVQGIYWNNTPEEVNRNMGKIILKLYNDRKMAKNEMKQQSKIIEKINKENGDSNCVTPEKTEAQGIYNGYNSIQGILKLILNSAYGKCATRKTQQKATIHNLTKSVKKPDGTWENKCQLNKYENYIKNNFNVMISSEKLSDNQIITKMVKPDESYNRGHIACAILSMSKRIMNEIFKIANEINAPIMYTDTDSMHVYTDDIPKIEKEFNRIHQRELIGGDLGQFHDDFDLKNAVSDIYSIKSIFLGKKSYIDTLQSTDASGKIINGFHNRLKGITQAGMDDAARRAGGIFKVYEKLMNDESINFLMNPVNEQTGECKVMFEYKNGNVITRGNFFREVSYA